ncbi:MAG: hypothetical protein AB1349_01195 [Elusimicrobiota bacterium]
MNNRGYSTFFLILVMLVLLTLSSSTVFLTANKTKKDVKVRIVSQALALAEAGIDRTIWKLKGNFAFLPTQKIVYNDFASGEIKVEVENIGAKIKIVSESNYRGEKEKIEAIIVSLFPTEMQNALTSFSKLKLLTDKIKWGIICSGGDIFFVDEYIPTDIQIYSTGCGYIVPYTKLNSNDYRYFTNLHFYGDPEDSFEPATFKNISGFYNDFNWNILKEKAKEAGTYFNGSIPQQKLLTMDATEKVIFVDTVDGKEFSLNNSSNWAEVVVDCPVFQTGCLIIMGNLTFIGSGGGAVSITNTQTSVYKFLDNVFFSGFIFCAGKFSVDGNGKFFGSISANSFDDNKIPEIWYNTNFKYQPIPCFSDAVAIDSWQEIKPE